MNSTEPVQNFAPGAHPTNGLRHRSTPLFRAELASPVRSAIVRARQFLLSEQCDNGLWWSHRSTDASLPSLLVFWLTHSGGEHSELAQQCAARILELQLPSGGWSKSNDQSIDVSTSVQAYFALKLVGVDPSSERLAQARETIRQNGGADAADEGTRYLLAMFSQITWEIASTTTHKRNRPSDLDQLHVAFKALQSLRPAIEIEIERGIRELFVRPPGSWPALGPSTRMQKRSAAIRERLYQLRKLGRLASRRSACGASASASNDEIDPLSFEELIWRLFTLRAADAESNSASIEGCERRLFELTFIDEDENTASPSAFAAPTIDTSLVVQSLLNGGVPWTHATISAAIDAFVSTVRQQPASQSVSELCSLLVLSRPLKLADADCGLPPSIGVCWDEEISPVVFESSRNSDDQDFGPLLEKMGQRLISLQNRDGGWAQERSGEKMHCPTSAAVTGQALVALRDLECSGVQPARNAAAIYLCQTQHADGSWDETQGGSRTLATALAVRGLLAAGLPASNPTIAAGLNWLIVHQQRDGGWAIETSHSGDLPKLAQSTTLTAHVVLALVDAGRETHVATRRAVEFLIGQQDLRGRWNDESFHHRHAATNRCYRNDLEATALPLQALSRWAVAASAAQSGDTDKVSLRLVGSAN